jgi:hypothetical protein
VHTVDRIVASDVLDNDVDIVTVQKLLGHVSVQTTASDDRRGHTCEEKRWGRSTSPPDNEKVDYWYGRSVVYLVTGDTSVWEDTACEQPHA